MTFLCIMLFMSLVQQCALNVTGGGFITAQNRELANDPSGYVFRGCEVSGTGHGDLGRAYGSFSRVIFIDSKLSNVVDPGGWNIWRQHGHELVSFRSLLIITS